MGPKMILTPCATDASTDFDGPGAEQMETQCQTFCQIVPVKLFISVRLYKVYIFMYRTHPCYDKQIIGVVWTFRCTGFCSDPGLVQVIRENPEAFMRLLQVAALTTILAQT